MNGGYDILGLGSVSIDEVLRVERWPDADTKMRVQSRERRLGGLTGLALAAAARLGARCAYAGRLGTDEDSQGVLRALMDAGIDTTHAAVDSAYGVVRSTVIAASSGSSRNVFSHPATATGAHETLPSDEIIRHARVLLVDHHGVDGSIRAAQVAINAGVPVVGDFERDDHPRFRELLHCVDHLILSQSFAQRITKTGTAETALAQLWHAHRKMIIVTTGADGGWFRECSMSRAEHFSGIRVEATDTTGCGDIFHGAYAAALAENRSPLERITLGSFAAAYKASRHHLATRAELEDLARSRL